MKKILMAEFNEYNCAFKLGDHHYADQFSKNGYEVLWLSPIYNHLYYFKDRNSYKVRKQLHNKPLKKLDKNTFGYSPYSLMLYGKFPILNSNLANILSLKLTIPSLKLILKKSKFIDVDILWLTNPKYYHLLGIVNYKKLFYRCADDLSGFDNNFQSFLKLEKKIIEQADEVFITSYDLQSKKMKLRNNFVYLPNGVDRENFIRNKYYIPNEFMADNKPKCIYVGAIEKWFDVNLVKFCANKLKNVSFYLIGPQKIDVDVLKEESNIHILGKKKYSEIPDYIHNCDVGIIPFKVNNLTNSVSPIKLYEYMSLGLNVVSTNFKEITYLKSPAYIAKSYDEFCSNIIQAIRSKESNKMGNMDFSQNNTWEKRFEIIRQHI